MDSKVLYEVAGPVARITLNRPDKRNALDAELIESLKHAMAVSAADPAIRVVTINGAGKDFCSGADLSAVEKASRASVLENIEDARLLAELFLAIRRHPHPVLALVTGRALAGGCGLATACDLILASESAQFGYPEVNIGFVPAMVMAILRRSMPEKAAFELLVSGGSIPAARALELGLIHRVFADSMFESEAQTYVDRLASKSGSAVTLTKRLLYQMDTMPFETAIEAGVQTNAIARQTDDCRAGVAKFLNKDKS